MAFSVNGFLKESMDREWDGAPLYGFFLCCSFPCASQDTTGGDLDYYYYLGFLVTHNV